MNDTPVPDGLTARTEAPRVIKREVVTSAPALISSPTLLCNFWCTEIKIIKIVSKLVMT